jgi:hypothetical protein
MNDLKPVKLGGNKYRVLAIPFGGPLNGKDADQEFFSAKTDIKPNWFDRRPLLFHHGQDSKVKDESIGYTDDLEQDEEGWWVTAWVDRASRYWQRINELMEAKVIFGSSGTLNYLAKVDHKSGEILTWPFVEETFTPTPANFFSRLTPAKTIDHFDLAGIDLNPAVRGILSDLDSQAADLPADLSTGGELTNSAEIASDLPTGGDAAAIQGPVRNPDWERTVRKLATFTARMEQLKNT